MADIEVSTFAGQNWLIVPAANSVSQSPPTIHNQQFLLVLSGVTIPNLKGVTDADWLRETLHIFPDIRSPLDFAINSFGVPRPAGTEGNDYVVGFQLTQWAPFAALSSIWDQYQSVNAGFAVDVWRPSPFDTQTDAFTGNNVGNLFTGIRVDVAVRDSDAWLFRVSYNITLLGKIVFLKPQIIF